MSVEHQPKPNQSMERASNAEIAKAAKERLEELSANPENTTEHAENRAEAAREAINQHTEDPEPAAEAEAAAPAAPSFIARLDHAINYTQTMQSIQRKLTPASRSFSKVIHTPAVEKASEALEKTVMRPSVVAGATWSAAIVGTIFYITARVYGWTLTGSEMLVALAAGALLGIGSEAVSRLLRRRP